MKRFSTRKRSLSRRDESEAVWAAALQAAAGVARRAAASEGDVLRAVTEELRRLNLRGGVLLLNPDGMLEVQGRSISNAVVGALRRLTGLDIAGYTFDPLDVDVYRKVLAERRPQLLPNRASTVYQMTPKRLRPLVPRIMGLIEDIPVIIAPLILDDELLGTINVSSAWLTEDDIDMVLSLADHVAISLGHVRARSEMRAALARERLRNQVAEAISSALDLDILLQRVLRLTSEAIGADAGAIAIPDPEFSSLRYSSLLGFPEGARFPAQAEGVGVAWQVINQKQPVLLENYRKHPHAIPEWVDAGVRACMGVPLIFGDEAIGAMALFGMGRTTSFSEDQVELVMEIARMAAIAVHNARLFDEARQRAEESQALIQTARSVSATLDYQTVLHLIAEQANDLLKADASRIHLLDQDSNLLRCIIASDPLAETLMSLEIAMGEGLVGLVAQTGKPMLVNDAAKEKRALLIPGTEQEDEECLILAPLIARQRTMGVMTVRRIGLENPFASTDVDLLTAFAAQAAQAIEKAHLYGQIQLQAQRLEVEVAERTRDLAISEARYRSLVETSIAGILQIDSQGLITYANQALAEMVGIPQDQLIGQDAVSLGTFNEDQVDTLRTGFEAPMRGTRSANEVLEFELHSADGHTVPCLMAVSRISDDADNPQGVTGMLIDFSQHKALEAALQAERNRLDAILANAGDAVHVTDAEGVIEYVNPAWERLNGYTAEEAIGQTPRMLNSGKHPSEFYDELWETILSGKMWTGEVVNKRKDGTFYDTASTIQPVLDETGNVINFVTVQHDISALKELDRLKSQLVSDVSHELRTPLTNIRLYLDLLRETREKTKVTSYLETLSRESDRLAHLIDGLLSLSRLEYGTTGFKFSPVDINKLLTALASDRTLLASQSSLELVVEPGADLTPIQGDEQFLSQVFTNLLTNAMNFSPAGSRITLRSSRRTISDQEWITAEVEDTGIGIPPDELPHIFERFFRGKGSQSTGSAGTGLGLAICKEIVEMHGGRIEVESEPGQGSTFRVWLPVHDGSQVEKLESQTI